MDGMSIRDILNRILDFEFGAYPATRGVGHVTVPAKAHGLAVEKRRAEVAWAKRDLALAHDL